jgi:predicted metal-dependent HD superfamily phosphohydrolase
MIALANNQQNLPGKMTLMSPATRDELSKLYSPQGRYYHTMGHTNVLLNFLEAHCAHFAIPNAIEAAM